MTICPFCQEEKSIAASVCPHCNTEVPFGFQFKTIVLRWLIVFVLFYVPIIIAVKGCSGDG